MGIGTSQGTHFEDEFSHQAGIPLLPDGDEDMVKKPADTGDDNVLPPEEGSYDNKSGVTKAGLQKVYITGSDNIEDRRDQDYTNTQKQDGSGFNWEGLGRGARDIAVSAGNSIWGTPQILESERSELSDQLGREDMHLEPNVGRSMLQRFIDDPQTGANMFGLAKGKAWSDSLTEEHEPTLRTDVTDKLFGLNGVERYKTWPEKALTDLAVTAGKVSRGEIPMWSMTPDGEFHTSIEGIEAAHKLMPAANNLPISIQMRGAGLAALEAYHEAPYETGSTELFQQALRHVRRQPSNIQEGEVLPPSPPATPGSRFANVPYEDFARRWNAGEDLNSIAAPRPEPATPNFDQEPFHEGRSTATEFHNAGEHNPYMPEAFRNMSREQVDALPDERFYHYGEYQARGRMSPVQEARWSRIDRELTADAHAQQEGSWEPTRTTEISGDHIDIWDQPAVEAPTHWSKDIRTKVDQAVKNDKISFFKDERRSDGREHEFKFASKDGIGKISITTKLGGKELYVDHIGRVNQAGHIIWGDSAAHSFGTSEMKQLVKTLMKEFPKAEVLSGTRVSGARFNSNSVGYASTRLPGRGKTMELRNPSRRPPSNDETDRALEAIRQALDSGSHLE